jgi:hypothetical protein
MDRGTSSSTRKGSIRINKTMVLAFILILLNAQVFRGKGSNPFGVDGVQELFYLILLLWAIVSLWLQHVSREGVRRLDVYVLLLVLMPSIYGSFAAYLTYGQPLIFGMLEERRIFSVLIYFPIRTLFERKWLTIDRFETLIVVIAAICALLSIATLLRIVPALQEVNTSEVALRSERISIGSSWIALSIPFLVSSQAAFIQKWRPFLLILALGTLLVIIQSRQLILLSFVTSIFVIRGPRAAFMIAGLIAAIFAAILFIPAFQDRVMIIVQLFREIGSEQYIQESWRAMSYKHVFESVPQAILGHGSLSPFWRDGFERVIGVYFYLADIGLVGTLFRYGLPGIVLYFLWFALQLRLLRAIPDRRRRVLCGALFLFIIMGMPVGAPLEYRGDVTGMLLGMSGYLASLKYREKA